MIEEKKDSSLRLLVALLLTGLVRVVAAVCPFIFMMVPLSPSTTVSMRRLLMKSQPMQFCSSFDSSVYFPTTFPFVHLLSTTFPPPTWFCVSLLDEEDSSHQIGFSIELVSISRKQLVPTSLPQLFIQFVYFLIVPIPPTHPHLPRSSCSLSLPM